MTTIPIKRIVLYKHGVGYFEREATVDGDSTLSLTFKQREVSDVLKSLTVLDLDGGHISSVSYDSTKPLEQLLAEVAIEIPDKGSLVGLLPQIKGARVALHTGVSDPVEGSLLGIDTAQRHTGDGVVNVVLVSIITDSGAVRSFDLHGLASLQMLDDTLRRDLEYYLKTQLSSKKKDARTFTFFAEGQGQRTVRLSYTLEAPVWKATYRIILRDGSEPPMIQGWAVVDNTQDEDWEDVELSLISGLPVSFVHDLYTPRYIRRPEVAVPDTTGVSPPEVEVGMADVQGAMPAAGAGLKTFSADLGARMYGMTAPLHEKLARVRSRHASISTVQTQVTEQAIGDLLEYQIEHPVTIRRNQSALVPIVLRPFGGQSVLLYNKINRAANPMSAVLFKNTTGLTLEGGPVTVLQESSYVGEAMIETIKPDEERLVPYAVESSVRVLDNFQSHEDEVDRVVLRDGILTTFRRHVRITTYTFDNKADREYIVYLEHPRLEDWDLFDTPKPLEITENFWRFKFTLSAKATMPFVVREQTTFSHTHQLADMNPGGLAYWIKQRYFDEPTANVLRETVKHREEMTKLQQQITALQKECEEIQSAQDRIRENLQSLGDRASEKDLRERYVRTLNNQEDRLETINAEVKKKQEAVEQCREKMKELLAKLEYEGEVR